MRISTININVEFSRGKEVVTKKRNIAKLKTIKKEGKNALG